MFDIGWTELVVIGVVALIVIGPKDLPELFRTLGRFTAKARGMAREFQRAMESAADEAGVRDVADDLRKATSARNLGLDAVKSAAGKFEAWDPMKPRPATPSAPAATAVTGAASVAAAPAADAAAAAPVTPAVAPAAPVMGPATAALAEEVAAKRAAAQAALSARQAPDAKAADPVAEPKDPA